jgi:hypothetical protein
MINKLLKLNHGVLLSILFAVAFTLFSVVYIISGLFFEQLISIPGSTSVIIIIWIPVIAFFSALAGSILGLLLYLPLKLFNFWFNNDALKKIIVIIIFMSVILGILYGYYSVYTAAEKLGRLRY